MKIHIVMDLIYGSEGNPGVAVFMNEADAIAEENRLIAEDPQDGTYLVMRETADLAMPVGETMLKALLLVQDDYRDILRAAINNEESDEVDAMLQIVDPAIEQAQAAGLGTPE